RLVHVAHAREVLALVDDAVALARPLKAREDDGLGDRNVLVHAHGAGGCTDDPPDLIADRERHRGPRRRPRADASLRPRPRVVGDAVLDGGRHRAERVVDQVCRVLEDREAVAVLEQLRHLTMNSRMNATASSGWSRNTPCPAPSKMRSSACGIAAAMSSESATGVIGSRSPPITSVGQRMFDSSGKRSTVKPSLRKKWL